jgi:hypothetical protein
LINEVSLSVPVTSGSCPNSIDEDTPESESSQKSTKKKTLHLLDNYDDSEESSALATSTTTNNTTAAVTALTTTATSSSSNVQPQTVSISASQTDNSNLRFSHLSIKFIDDNSASAPLSPEQQVDQQQQQQQQQHHQHPLKMDDELKPYEPSDTDHTDADLNLPSTLATFPPSHSRKTNICLIDVNKELTPTEKLAASGSNVSLDSTNSSRKKKRHHHHRHQKEQQSHQSSQEIKRSVTADNLVQQENAGGNLGTPINVSLNFGTSKTEHRKGRKERRHRHTIPIANAATDANVKEAKDDKAAARKAGSNSNLNENRVSFVLFICK